MSFGPVLQEARASQGRDLQQLAAETRIRSDYLRALEEENFGALPERIFARSFLQRYARELRLDPQPLLADFDERQPYAAVINYGHLDAAERRTAPARTSQAQPGSLVLPLLLGAVLLLVGGGYLASRSRPAPVAAAPAAPPAPAAPANVNRSVSSVPSGARVYLDNRDLGATPVQSFPVGARKSAVLRVEYAGRMSFKGPVDLRSARNLRARLLPAGEGPSILTDVVTGRAQESLPVPPPRAPVKGVRLSFSDNSWLRVTAPGGEVLFEGMVPSGSTKTYDAGVTVRAGNAAAVQASVNGAPPQAMGSAGQVASQTF